MSVTQMQDNIYNSADLAVQYNKHGVLTLSEQIQQLVATVYYPCVTEPLIRHVN